MSTDSRTKVAVTYNKTSEPLKQNQDFISEFSVVYEAKAVYAALLANNHQAEYFPVENINDTLVHINKFNPDVIFNLCEGFRGKSYYEMHMAALWELLKIPYTGNSPLTLGISLNKVLTKKLFSSKRIPTPMYQIYNRIPEKTYLSFPLIAKPTSEDASLGITQKNVVQDFEEMKNVVELLLEKYKQPIMLEQYIEGREFNISIMGNNPPQVLAISEIDFSKIGKDFYPITSYEAKWLKNHPL
jgi:D-alanine-D-alanine ligase